MLEIDKHFIPRPEPIGRIAELIRDIPIPLAAFNCGAFCGRSTTCITWSIFGIWCPDWRGNLRIV